MSNVDVFDGFEQKKDAIGGDVATKERAPRKLKGEEKRIADLWFKATGLKYENHIPQWQQYIRVFARIVKEDTLGP